MQNDQDEEFIDLSYYLTGSQFLFPYKKERLGRYFGDQFLTAIDLLNEGEISQSLAYFDEVYQITPTFFIHEYIRMVEAMKSETPEILLERLSKYPYNDFVENIDKFLFHVTKASLHLKMFDAELCISQCSLAINVIDYFSPIYIMRADSNMLIHKHKEAITDYKIALKVDHKTENVKVNLGYAYLQLKRNRKARRLFKQVVDHFPENYKVQYNMALCYLRTKKIDLALTYLDRVEKLNPDFSGLHLTRGGIYLAQNKKSDAIKSFRRAKELGSENANNILKKIDS